jgi:hypothetical protein
MARPKGIAWQAVERLAEAGVTQKDIILALDLPVAAVSKEREKLAAVTARGHAKFRTAVAKRLQREGIFKGRAHSLLGLARLHLGLDARRPDDEAGLAALFAVSGAAQRLVAMLDKMARNRAAEAEDKA